MSDGILIVEDESIVALDLKLQLQDLGYDVVGIAASGEEALRLAASKQPDLVLMDVRLQGDMSGIEAAARLRQTAAPPPLIYLTSHSDGETVRRAAATAPYGYLTKPFQINELRAGIAVALAKARLERQLKEADRWFTHTLRCVEDGVVVCAADGGVRLMNPAAERLSGHEFAHIAGRRIQSLITLQRAGDSAPVDLAAALAAAGPTTLGHALLLSASGAGQAQPGPAEPDPPEGAAADAVRRVDASTSPVFDDAGRRLGAVLVLRDAKERLAREQRLAASEQRLHRSFEHAPLGMALVALDGRILQANEAFGRLLGSAPAALQGRSQRDVTAAADRAHEETRLQELMGSGDAVAQFEKRYTRLSDGAPVWALVSVSLLTEGGAPASWLYQVHDLTEQRNAAQRLAALTEERLEHEASQLAAQARQEFLARVSHEMRTPLNAVLGFAQLLQLAEPPAEGAKAALYVEQIRLAGEHLLTLVNDVLELQSEAGPQFKLKPEPLALRTVVDEVFAMLASEAASAQVALPVDVPPGLKVLADRTRLRQVLLNLASNAIKYNRPGGHARAAVAAAPAPGCVCLVIEDNGLGMTPQQLERLFQPFDRLGREQSGIAGVGLGLVIARRMVAAMGGSLAVESGSGGTRVRITLPQG
jgi:PAS domain S-box-containing protein